MCNWCSKQQSQAAHSTDSELILAMPLLCIPCLHIAPYFSSPTWIMGNPQKILNDLAVDNCTMSISCAERISGISSKLWCSASTLLCTALYTASPKVMKIFSHPQTRNQSCLEWWIKLGKCWNKNFRRGKWHFFSFFRKKIEKNVEKNFQKIFFFMI